jgi:hypothetical protein
MNEIRQKKRNKIKKRNKTNHFIARQCHFSKEFYPNCIVNFGFNFIRYF